MDNKEKEVTDTYLRVLDVIENSLNKELEHLRKFTKKGEVKTKSKYHCDHCDKIINEGFVKVTIWKNMHQCFNDIIGKSLKIYHIKCYNELNKSV